jgi:hypothetical protein
MRVRGYTVRVRSGTCAHVCVCILLDGLSLKLVETFLGSHKLAWLTSCVRMSMSVHTMRLRARTCAHVCVRPLLGGFSSKLVEIVSGSYMGYFVITCALACAHYARACITRKRAFAHLWTDSLQIWKRMPWVT